MAADIRATVFLLVVAVALLGWLVYRLTRKPFSALQWPLYWLNLFLVRFRWHGQLPAHFPVPDGQGAILIANHRSSVDPCFIQAVARKRLVHWMVAQLYSPTSVIGRMMGLSEIIPIRTDGADISAIKTAIRRAKNGELVGIMPEGHINTTDELMLPVRPGAVMIALKAGVPILPCYIEGAPYSDLLWWPLFMTARVTLRFGPLLDFSDYKSRSRDPEVLAMLMDRAIQEIAKLAGTDYKMELAGRKWKEWSGWR